MGGLGGIDTALTIALAGVFVYFTALNAQSFSRYLRFRRMRHSALLTWPALRPPAHAFGLALGVVSAVLAIAGLALNARVLQTLSQGVTALYFLGIAPLLATIRRGFYGPGLWVEQDFAPYGAISRWTFHDSTRIELVLLLRRGGRALRLLIPADDYGTARKLLQQKAQEGVLCADPEILNLSQP